MWASVASAGQRAVPAFHLMAKRFLDKSYSPEEAEKSCGVSAETIRRIAAELAHAAVERSIELDVDWTDWAGRKQNKTGLV